MRIGTIVALIGYPLGALGMVFIVYAEYQRQLQERTLEQDYQRAYEDRGECVQSLWDSYEVQTYLWKSYDECKEQGMVDQ